MSVEISLNHGFVALVDAVDTSLVEGISWYANGRKGSTLYATGRMPGARKTISMHRLIMGFPEGAMVDHINGDGLDNRRENLRLATQSQNQWNGIKPRGGKSKYRGVSWRRDTKKWRANVCIFGKKVHLGHYDTEDGAAIAYDLAATRLFGEFAKLNFPV